MTRHSPERAATVAISSKPKSTSYARSQVSGQGISENLTGNNGANGKPSATKVSNSQSRNKALPPQWYRLTEALLQRHFKYGENLDTCAAELGMSLESVHSCVQQAELVSKNNIGLKFRQAKESNAVYPREPTTAAANQQAAKIAIELNSLVQRAPDMVRDAISLYTEAVRKDNRLVFKADAEAPGLRNLLIMIRRLHRTGVSVRMTGFIVEGERANLKPRLKLLNFTSSPPIHWVKAQNQNSPSSRKHLGIDIVCQQEQPNNPELRSSEAFRYVMAIAAIAQIWDLTVMRKTSPRHHSAKARAAAPEPNLELPFPEIL